jgi:predicted ABC-class ATPase
MTSLERLKDKMIRIDGQDYGAYQSLLGEYDYLKFKLYIDQIPKDPYAPPHTGVYRIRIPLEDIGIRTELISLDIRKIAFRDFLARHFSEKCLLICKGRRGTGNSGLITIEKPGQSIMDRSSVVVTDDYLEVRFFIGLPANGREIEAGILEGMLVDELPEIVIQSLFIKKMDYDSLCKHLEVAEDADFLRHTLEKKGLIAFVNDGALLPRRSGIDDKPLEKDKAILFESPESMRYQFDLPNAGVVTGMGIKKGITLIVGGGYHGKSTLLSAIELGVYNHIPGDGRELCVTVFDASKVRTYSGRSVQTVDISPFLNNIPFYHDTTSFSTKNASGSTSQAASIIEFIEAGASVLLLDEDTCSANFMIRDARMQELVKKEHEPITSFVDCIKPIYQSVGVSTILVMGGSGDYFEVADSVIQMKAFLPYDVTLTAKKIAINHPTGRISEIIKDFSNIKERKLLRGGISPLNEYQKIRISSPDINTLIFGEDKIDLSDVEQLVEKAQNKAIGIAISLLLNDMEGRYTMNELIQDIMSKINKFGVDFLDKKHTGDLVVFRSLELAAIINRMRRLKVKDDRN